MSKSPVKFVGAAAQAVSGGGNNPVLEGLVPNSAMDKVLGGFINKRQRKARLAQAKIDSRKTRSLTFKDRMRALGRSQSIASQASPEVVDSASIVENNNTIDNTVADAQDKSQMRADGALTSTAAPVGFSTMSSAVLDPISQQPMGGVQPVPNVQEQTTPEDVATYGVAGAAQSMFGTPMQRQMSMGSSLMKRACKYKNKK